MILTAQEARDITNISRSNIEVEKICEFIKQESEKGNFSINYGIEDLLHDGVVKKLISLGYRVSVLKKLASKMTVTTPIFISWKK